ncbi:MAG: RNA polymerase factor sigma-54, partial [Halieaceae bacterium]|nr:RNA polymerase factor sigma-54 [Halieaceae bacterium]
MKQSLQLKLGQQLTMTPQLQQAIRLLQLSTLDLQQEIQQALDSNPLLEAEEDDTFPGEGEADSREQADSTGQDGPMDSQDGADELAADSDWDGNLPEELPVDTQWDDLLPSASAPMGAADDMPDSDFESRNTAGESLQEQLLWQLNLTRLSDTDRLIALAIIDATDDNGRLQQELEELHEALLEGSELDIELDEIVAVLHRLQQFEPAGVCTRNLQECLLVQLRQLPPSTPWLEQARVILSRHLNQLGSGDFKQIMRRTRLSEEDLKEVLALIQSLDPNPGQSVAQESTEYVVPDVFVSKRDGRWVVELNPDIAPRLRINSNYAGLIKRADNSADNTFLRDNL